MPKLRPIPAMSEACVGLVAFSLICRHFGCLECWNPRTICPSTHPKRPFLNSKNTTFWIPDPNISAKVSRYKWEAYRDTKWGCIYYFLPRGGIPLQKHRDRNGRCIAILFKKVLGSGVDSMLLKIVSRQFLPRGIEMPLRALSAKSSGRLPHIRGLCCVTSGCCGEGRLGILHESWC